MIIDVNRQIVTFCEKETLVEYKTRRYCSSIKEKLGYGNNRFGKLSSMEEGCL